MAIKIYTAHEMREEAKLFELSGGSCTIPAMLRQAADFMERDEALIESRLGRAEKRLTHTLANELFDCIGWSIDGKAVSANAERVAAIQRRLRKQSDDIKSEVSEWEEVRDGE